MPSQKNLKENPEISIEKPQGLTLEGQEAGLHNKLAEETNHEIKAEMARELLSEGLSRQAVKRILNLPPEMDVFEGR